MMKRYLFFIMITTVLSFSANRLSAQNSLVLHLPDTVITLNGVDSVYYSHDANGVLMQHVVTMDSLYTFAVDGVDSMFYLSPVVTLNGVVRGGIPDSMLVMTLTDVLPVSDTNFTVTALRGDYRQLIVVTNLDTLPFMLYRGVLNPDETIVIDTMSTVMALLSWVMPFDSVLDSDYGQFCAIAEQCESFPTLYSLVAQSIAANRSLDDTLNNPMYEALGMVFAQIKQQITPSISMGYSYEQGNNVMLVETSGSLVSMRMNLLNPTYCGTVKDKDGNIIKGLRVPTRDNFGVGDALRSFFLDFLYNGDNWTDFTHGETEYFSMNGYSGQQLSFDFTCRNGRAVAEFIVKTFLLPILSFVGVDKKSGLCMQKLFVETIVSEIASGVQGVATTPFTMSYTTLSRDEQEKVVKEFSEELVGRFIDKTEDYLSLGADIAGCYFEAGGVENLKKIFKTVAKGLNAFSKAEEVLNTIARCIAYARAPENISFCLEWFSGTGDDAHYCTTPSIRCLSGNLQYGRPDEPLRNHIILTADAYDQRDVPHKRPMALHLKVLEGDGFLEDTLFMITTYSTIQPDVVYTKWWLGPDQSVPQRAVAWLTPQNDFSTTLGDSLELTAYFRADSFRVKINTYATFSKGNLQYQPSTSTWRFAEHQYDMIGMDNLNITDGDQTYTGWIDLFSWATRNNPTYVPINNTYYNNGGGNVFYDWGDNSISNGGNETALWRTPEFGEWNYLMTGRPNADSLHTFATVVNVPGMILLPDNWQMPDSVEFVPNIHNYTVNIYDTASWAILEDAGAVFLPAAGFRCRPSGGTFTVTQLDVAGAYWSSWGYPYYAAGSYVEQRYAYRMAFFGSSGRVFPYQGVECYWGQSVRLIRTL